MLQDSGDNSFHQIQAAVTSVHTVRAIYQHKISPLVQLVEALPHSVKGAGLILTSGAVCALCMHPPVTAWASFGCFSFLP